MSSLWLILPVSAVLVLFAMWAFNWAVNAKQFENLDVEARRILFEEGAAATQVNEKREGAP